ncbi:pyridoxamine 5'-phosphate oxidase, partial [Mycobacteroides abscessus subsp. massiliense]
AGVETDVVGIDRDALSGKDLDEVVAAHPGGTVLAHDDELGRDRPYTESEYLAHARATELLIYDFGVLKAYGNYLSA